jgi:hypothetical protein
MTTPSGWGFLTLQPDSGGSDICTGMCDTNGDEVCNNADVRGIARTTVGLTDAEDFVCAKRP